MALSATTPEGYARLSEFNFVTELSGDKIIDFGDGHTEIFSDFSASHIYENVGVYTTHVREACSLYPQRLNSTIISSLPVVNNNIEITESPLSGYSSEDDGLLFGVSLSATCPPPHKVSLSVEGTISQSAEPFVDMGNCEPKHFFYSNLPIENDVVTIQDPNPITVNGEVFGYHSNFCFGYVDDYFGQFDITAKLDVGCNLYSERNEVDFYNCLNALSAYGEETNLTSGLTLTTDWVWDDECFAYIDDATPLELGTNILTGTISWEGSGGRTDVNVTSPDETTTYMSGENRIVEFRYENSEAGETPTDYTITIVFQPCDCCVAESTNDHVN